MVNFLLRQRTSSSSSWLMLSDLMLNALAAVTLFLLPLLHRVDAEGRRAQHSEGIAAALAVEVEELGDKVVVLTEKNGGLLSEVDHQGGTIKGLKKIILDLSTINQRLTDGVAHLTVTNSGLSGTIGGLQGEVDALKQGRPVDVVFLFDTSASMELQNDRVRRAIALVGELLPRVTTLRVGVLTFQQAGYKDFPLQELKRPESDRGASRTKLSAFLNGASVANGIVDVAEASRRGMAMFEANAPKHVREVMVLVSDVAPGDVMGIDEQSSRRMKQELIAWTQEAGTDRRFLALFGHAPGYANPDYNPNRHRAVYRWLAKTPNGRFEDQAGAIFPVLFETMFAN